MRIVKKINLALVGVIGVSAALNLAILQLTVMPSFLELEIKAASRNQSRVLEAIEAQEGQVAASARDYAFWDDSYAFMTGQTGEYAAKNVNAESLKALSVNYFLAVEASGAIKLDKGFDFSAEDPKDVAIFPTGELPVSNPLRQPFTEAVSRSGLIRTDQGIVAVGYAPVLTSERTGGGAGTLLFGKVLDLTALREMTKVDFQLEAVAPEAPITNEILRGADAIQTLTTLTGIDGKPIARLTSTTSRSITSAGQHAIWAAMALLVLGGALLIAVLAFILRRIAVKRIEAMRRHLVEVTSNGKLEPIPSDGHKDELSDTIASFNAMTSQLAELRETLRRQDYHHGAADQAAGILHNVRNAVSPIGTIAWDLARVEDAPWKLNLAKALQQLSEPGLPTERAQKLQQFVTISASKLLAEAEKRQTDLRALEAMFRHVDGILKDEDAISQSERVTETIAIAGVVTNAAKIVERRPGISLQIDLAPEAVILGHRVVLEQILGNLLVNASEAIEASDSAVGVISISATVIEFGGGSALDIMVRDNGDGIPQERLETIFEKGFSTRRERSGGLGLHWCANAVNAMQGRLYAQSEGEGHGATLHIVLPQAKTELRNAA